MKWEINYSDMFYMFLLNTYGNFIYLKKGVA